MKIREAEFTDAEGLARVQVDSYRTAYAPLMPPEYIAAFAYDEQAQDWRDWMSAGRDEVLLVAETDGGEVAGYALAKKIDPAQRGYDCELAAIHVHATMKKQGIGRALIAAAARKMAQQGCRSLWLCVLEGNPASGFYERLGGVRDGEQWIEIEELGFKIREIGYGWKRIEDLF